MPPLPAKSTRHEQLDQYAALPGPGKEFSHVGLRLQPLMRPSPVATGKVMPSLVPCLAN